MKKCISFMFLFAASAAFAAQVDRVLVRQQWPWNADVRIEYVVSGLSAPAAVTFKFYDGDSQILVSDATALKGDATYAKNGTNVATFNPKTLFGPAAPAEYSAFKVQVVLGAENEAMGEKLYRIIDLDTGKVEDLTRADFYNGKYGAFETSYEAIKSDFSTALPVEDVFIWTDVTNNPAYRTSKMVLRKIPAANVEWMMGLSHGSPGTRIDATPHLVKLTSDYYIGVFPVTQAQYFKLKGSMGSEFTDDEKYENHEWYPVYGIPYNIWRGKTTYWTVDGSDVEENSYLDLLRKKCGGTILFDMPTEAQWEFACRGGNYVSPVYSGRGWTAGTLTELSWCDRNSVVTGTEKQPHPVGKKYPNAYGLYDMNGNMWEWCVDWSDGKDYEWTSTEEPEINPKGVLKENITLDANGNGYHISRGGAFDSSHTYCHPAYRKRENGSSTGNSCLRVVCPAE